MKSGLNSIIVDNYIINALKEDITNEDITTNSIIRENNILGEAELICKEDGILAGIGVFSRVFKQLENVEVKEYFLDGDEIQKGNIIARVEGNIKSILTGERTALNYLQRMSGIATLTRELANELKGSKTKLLDTRKTTPNMRIFEKYAVKVGGGYNHRFNLSDGILIKDNHINAAGGIKEAVKLAKEYASFVRKIEVEVESLDMLNDALEAGVDIVMLDNMDIETMREAVNIINGRALIECSGNINKKILKEISNLKVDYVSCGALTHSVKSLDFSLKNLRRI